jgi:hypothetical protein
VRLGYDLGMKIWSSLRNRGLSSILVLLMLAVALTGGPMRDRMDSMMASGSHHMTMPQMGEADAMSKGLGHAACQILCLGATVTEPKPMPVAVARLLQIAFVPSPALDIEGRSPDPAPRPPQAFPIA